MHSENLECFLFSLLFIQLGQYHPEGGEHTEAKKSNHSLSINIVIFHCFLFTSLNFFDPELTHIKVTLSSAFLSI